MLNPEYSNAKAASINRRVAGEHEDMSPAQSVHKHGDVADLSSSSRPLIATQGVTVAMTPPWRDRDEAVSVQSLYGAVFEACPDAMVCADEAGMIMMVNQQASRLFGYDCDELVGQLMGVLVHPPFRFADAGIDQGEANKAGSSCNGSSHTSARRKDGSTFTAEIITNSADVGGAVVLIAVVRDVTVRCDDERGLQSSEGLVRQITESIDVALVLRSLDPPQFLYVSPRYEQIFGYNPLADSGKSADVFSHVFHGDRARYRSDYWEPAQAGLFARCEYRLLRADGDIRWVRSTNTPVVDTDDVVRRCASVAEDITDVKQVETALRTVDEARKANEAKNEFLSRMSHELRTPMNAVLGFAQLLEMDDLTGDQQAAVKYILRGGRHLVALIDDVLDISKIEADRLDLSLESLLMSELLTDTVALMMPVANSADIGLSFNQTDGANQHVHGDARRLRQVVLNLLSNAIKYNRSGGRVEVRCELSAGTGVDIVVQDTGLGIPAEQLPRLFTPFDRLGAQSTTIEGSGVGLALSHRLMTTMGGSLTATSQLGVGSVFRASVPLAEPASLPPTLPPPPSPAGTPAAAPGALGRTMTLLYIEDNNSNITLMQQLLTHRPQWNMIAAGSGNIGLDAALTLRPNLILLDLHLPDMDGTEVLHRLRADPRTSDLRIVMVSADARPSQMNRLLAAGAYAYLSKPLDVARMLELLDAFVAHPANSRLNAPHPHPGHVRAGGVTPGA